MSDMGNGDNLAEIAASTEDIARAIVATFRSVNVMDSNYEAANIVDAISHVASALLEVAKAIKETA